MNQNNNQQNPNLYTYYDNKYNLQDFLKIADSNLDPYLQSKNLKDEDRTKTRAAAVDMLNRIRNNQSDYYNLNGIHFTNNDLQDKSNDKYYKYATQYISDVFGQMNPYQEPKPTDVKLNTANVFSTIMNYLNGGTGSLYNYYKSDSNSRRQQLANSILKTKQYYADRIADQKKYNVIPELDRTNQEWLQGLDNIARATLTPSTKDDQTLNQWGLGDLSRLTSDNQDDWLIKKDTADTKVNDAYNWIQSLLSQGKINSNQANLLKKSQDKQDVAKAMQTAGIDQNTADEILNPVVNQQQKQNITKTPTLQFNTNKLIQPDLHESAQFVRDARVQDFNNLPTLRRTYENQIVRQLKSDNFGNKTVSYNGKIYNTKNVLMALVNRTLQTKDGSKQPITLYHAHRKGQNNGNLYILTKSYNPSTKNVVYYNDSTHNFSFGKADQDFITLANKAEMKPYLKEGGQIIKMQQGDKLTRQDSIDLGWISPTDQSIQTKPIQQNTVQPKQEDNGFSTLMGNIEGITGIASLVPGPWSYPAAVASGITGMLGTATDETPWNLGKLTRMGTSALSFIPGEKYVEGLGKIKSLIGLGKGAVSGTEGALEAAKASKTSLLSKIEQTTDKTVRKDLKSQLGDINKTIKNLQKPARESSGLINQATRLGTNFGVSGALMYGIPGMSQQLSDNSNNPSKQFLPNVVLGTERGFQDFGQDINKAFGKNDPQAWKNLGTMTFATLLPGLSHSKSKGQWWKSSTQEPVATTEIPKEQPVSEASNITPEQPITQTKQPTTADKKVPKELDIPFTATAAVATLAALRGNNTYASTNINDLNPISSQKIHFGGDLNYEIPQSITQQGQSSGNWKDYNKIASEMSSWTKTNDGGLIVYDPNNKPYSIKQNVNGNVEIRNSQGKNVGLISKQQWISNPNYLKNNFGLYPTRGWSGGRMTTSEANDLSNRLAQMHKYGGILNILRNNR